MRARHAALLLVALLGAWNLWGYDLWAPDEPYFGEGAREMVVDGHWAVPHVGGVVTTDKPPLFFWLIALFSLPFGAVSSVTARLPSVLAAIGTAALTMRLGRRMGAADGGALAGFVLAVTYLSWDKSRSAQIDALLCFLVLVAVSALEACRSGDADGRRAGLLFWTASALAVLAKGPVGVLVPLGIAIVTLAFDRRLGTWRRFAPFSGPLLFVAIVAAWMALATIGGHGEYSVWGAFERHVLERAVQGLHHRQPPWYYLEVLPVQLLPWSGLVPGALLLAWRRRGAGPDRFLLVFALFVILFFTIPTEKRNLYVLPAFPAFALLFWRIAEAASRRRLDAGAEGIHPRWVTIPLGFTGAALAVGGVALPIMARRFGTFPVTPVLTLAAALAAGGIAMVVTSGLGRPRAATIATIAATSVVYLVCVTAVYPALDPFKSARSFALAVEQETAASRGAGERVVSYGVGNLPQAIAFYSNGVYLRELPDLAALAAHLERDARVFAVVDPAAIASLPPEVSRRVVVSRSASVGSGKVALISNRPPPR